MSYPSMFKSVVTVTLGFEGGTNPDPVDRGGLTKYGVSSKQYPEVKKRHFGLQDALEIYYYDYW